MKARLAATVILLVLLPTAILSLLASRALRSGEVLLQRRLESSAHAAIRTVAQRVSAALDDELARVSKEMAACIEHGAPLQEIRARAFRLEEGHDLVGRVYLFMNPWGWVWPEDGPARVRQPPVAEPSGPEGAAAADLALLQGVPQVERARPVQPEAEILTAALRREIASASPGYGALSFSLGARRFVFGAIRDREGVYAGYEVARSGFRRELAAAIADVGGRDFVLVATEVQPASAGAVLVRGSLGQPAKVVEEVLVPGRPAGAADTRLAGEDSSDVPIARGVLAPPYESVAVVAHARDPLSFRRAGWMQRRLFAWGIFVLAGVIAAGVWLMIREAAAAMRDARARTDYVAGISHDLRTPIAAMKMLAESLYLGHVSSAETQRRFLGTIVRECERLNQLTDRVLFFVRFGQNALVYQFCEMDPGALAASAVETFRARFVDVPRPAGGDGRPDSSAARGRLQIEEHVDLNLPPVRVDAAAMTQVILNLLDNAAKYGRRGNDPERNDGGPPADTAGCAIRVSVRRARARRRALGRRENWVRLSVQDFGPGIPRRELRRIFRRFYRAPGSRDENVSGVGLGLAICRHVVHVHRGWITAESKPGSGSTFSVYLPAVLPRGPHSSRTGTAD